MDISIVILFVVCILLARIYKYPHFQVKATDADFGANAEISYRIAKGAYDDFAIDPSTGEVTLSGELNFDTREYYELEIVAVDGGYPSLSGKKDEVCSKKVALCLNKLREKIDCNHL